MVVTALTLATLLVAVVAISEWDLRRQGYRMRRTPPTKQIGHQFGPEAITVHGGTRIGIWNADWFNKVALTADESCARLEGIPPVWIRRADVSTVRRISGLLGSGIRFDTPSGDLDGVIFWSRTVPNVLVELERLGWPVTPERRRAE